uniref:Uncharacterized protein n=1 Tax=Brassica oleracea var. oleracea TaxID=109376 RepID=A0A0D3DB38_BRAOL
MSSETLAAGDGGETSAGPAPAYDKQKEKARVSRPSLILCHDAHQNDASAVWKLLEKDQSLTNISVRSIQTYTWRVSHGFTQRFLLNLESLVDLTQRLDDFVLLLHGVNCTSVTEGEQLDMDCVREKLTSGSVRVAAEENHPSGGDLLPQNQSMDSFQMVGNSSSVICPHGGGSELSSLEAEAYHSNQTCSPRKTSASSNISSSEIIIDRESTSYSESFKFQFNGIFKLFSIFLMVKNSLRAHR